jgi:hypothetical protein
VAANESLISEKSKKSVCNTVHNTQNSILMLGDIEGKIQARMETDFYHFLNRKIEN